MNIIALLWACGNSQLCPKGLVPIPSTSPKYCIMQYEARVRNGRAYSEKGAVPSAKVSFRQAREICARTPVRDARNQIVGTMRLSTVDEWRDAGDGVIGAGGSLYPWGDSPEAERCPLEHNQQLSGVQPAGSHEDCRSSFGVYDQLGNLWEWADSGQSIDMVQWSTSRTANGGGLKFIDGRMVYAGVDWSETYVHAPGLNGKQLVAHPDGYLSIYDERPSERLFTGYLITRTGREEDVLDATQIVPVKVDFRDNPTYASIRINDLRDGEPIAIKIGGAYYSGAESNLQALRYGHEPDFVGTIGFRCVSDPL